MSKKDREEELDARVDILRERLKDSDDFKVKGDVFDTRTLVNLYQLAKKGIIDALGGPISTGKEANIFSALKDDKYLAIKIYRIATTDFRSMHDYIQGDPRFNSVKGNRRGMVTVWTKKEYRNLLRAEAIGIAVPHPLVTLENILVMEFIGENGLPAPQLKDVDLETEEATKVAGKLSDYIADLYHKANLVHADLSEFNILYTGVPVIIDMGQAVTLDHPRAQTFLKRDITNLSRFFERRYKIRLEDEIWGKIKGQ